jgi:excisionase family DNA binding protein
VAFKVAHAKLCHGRLWFGGPGRGRFDFSPNGQAVKNSDPEKTYTSGEVARICGVSADTVSRWFDAGHVEGYRLGPGGDRRIPEEKLRTFMLRHGIPLDRLDGGARCILVVDDDPHYLDIIPKALAKTVTYEIVTCSTGFDAGTVVAQRNPRLLILDINLADMDGRHVARQVKSRPETRYSRLLAISGFIETREFADLKNDGFDDHLRKPFSLDDLAAKVQALLRLSDSKVSQPTVK